MKILFVMRHSGYIRNFESTVRLLAERGHQVHLAFQNGKHWLLDPGDIAEQLTRAYPNITHGPAPSHEQDGWAIVSEELRRGVDFLRYFEPCYRDAPKLRARAEREAPAALQGLARWPVVRSTVGARVFGRGLRLLDRTVPLSRRVAAFIRWQKPDIVLVTPLVEPGSPQAEYVRVANALGVRSGLCVYSWDNLTNKGLVQYVPDVITVWNEPMKREAVELHGVPSSRVVVTGAQSYDHWFEWQPSTSREEFCRQVGLPADRPFILYMCSSKFIAPKEVRFVKGWIRRLRRSGERSVREAGVLIRLHPQNVRQWGRADLSGLGDVAVWPRAADIPVDARSRAQYYDSIYHCAAVVGVNTSALIESAIVGRPVHTLLAQDFRDTQEGTLHFHHLRDVNGGLLRVAESFEEHTRQLAEALAGEGEGAERGCRFLEGFVRPFGLEVPATPKVVDAIEAACARPVQRRAPSPPGAALLRLGLIPRLLYVRRRGTVEQRLADRRRSDADRMFAERTRLAANLADEARAIRTDTPLVDARPAAESEAVEPVGQRSA